MKVLVFIVFVAIALAVFYLFTKKTFEQGQDATKKDTDDSKLKPLLPEETKQDEDLENDTISESEEPEQYQDESAESCLDSVATCPYEEEEKTLDQQE